MSRCFVIGNGITLKPEDLDLIKDQPSYACNRINLIYKNTEWRPTVYVHPETLAQDAPYIQENIDLGITCWVGEHYWNEIKPSGKTKFIKDCHHHLMKYDDPDLPGEWHPPQPCTFGGSVSYAMQRAWMDGFDEIVLLGCDLLYKDGKQSHFDPNYEHGGEQPAWYAARNAMWAHVNALNYINRKNLNIKIFNATRGGNLFVWPRVRLEDYV
jgi:hypothetical protein